MLCGEMFSCCGGNSHKEKKRHKQFYGIEKGGGFCAVWLEY